uniref:Uncharacterized protein n=1 Tax=Cynoglossus semilaevis TaxID=244447 RepID=A0A3P8WEN6_CYNSE
IQRANMNRPQNVSAAPSYLGWSIFNTLCCCLPLGIIAIVYSNKVYVYNSLGESSAAQGASRTAKVLNIVGLVFGLIMTAIGIIYMAVIVNAFSRRY